MLSRSGGVLAVWLCVALGGLALLGIVVVDSLTRDQAFDNPDLLPCPNFPVRIQATDVNLAPGLIEHQSWVEFPVPREFAGWYGFCLDGRLLDMGGGRLDFSRGLYRFSVQTRSVDREWLFGRLDGFRDVQRWELRLLCGGDSACP